MIRSFNSNIKNGLTSEQAKKLLHEHGYNEMAKAYQTPIWLKFIYCFFSGFAPLLWVAAFFVFLSWKPFGTPPSNIYNLALAIVLLIVIFLSGIFNFIQDVQTSSVLSSISELIPSNSLVMRDGTFQSMDPKNIVVGDIIQLENGAKVPSDVRIIQSSDLKIDKSMITGETNAIRLFDEIEQPDSILLQARNMAFMGCNVVEGEGLGIVIATGADNQLSKIAASINNVKVKNTALQNDINKFVLIISILSSLTVVVVVLEWAFYLRVQYPDFMSVSSMIANAISVIVAFVPEGLPLALSMGLTIIARRLCFTYSVLVKQLSIVETLGSMTVLASDKTGTLTQNKMVVKLILSMQSNIDANEIFKSAQNFDKVKNFIKSVIEVSLFCNQANYDDSAENVSETNTNISDDKTSRISGVRIICI